MFDGPRPASDDEERPQPQVLPTAVSYPPISHDYKHYSSDQAGSRESTKADKVDESASAFSLPREPNENIENQQGEAPIDVNHESGSPVREKAETKADQQNFEHEGQGADAASGAECLQVEAGLPLSLGAFVQRQAAFSAALAAAAGIFPQAVHITSIADDGPATAAGPGDTAVIVRADLRGLSGTAISRLTKAALDARLVARGLPPVSELDAWSAAPALPSDSLPPSNAHAPSTLPAPAPAEERNSAASSPAESSEAPLSAAASPAEQVVPAGSETPDAGAATAAPEVASPAEVVAATDRQPEDAPLAGSADSVPAEDAVPASPVEAAPVVAEDAAPSAAEAATKEAIIIVPTAIEAAPPSEGEAVPATEAPPAEGEAAPAGVVSPAATGEAVAVAGGLGDEMVVDPGDVACNVTSVESAGGGRQVVLDLPGTGHSLCDLPFQGVTRLVSHLSDLP